MHKYAYIIDAQIYVHIYMCTYKIYNINTNRPYIMYSTELKIMKSV